MKKHIVVYDIELNNSLFLSLSGWMYWQKRLQFWKWKSHKTMGRPILMLRRISR